MLSKDEAWDTLDLPTRQRLYALLPAPSGGEAPHDPTVNPMQTDHAEAIEFVLEKWQSNLKDGRETKKWRDEAVRTGRERAMQVRRSKEESGEEDKKV
jgi:hypothetical protein